MNSKAAIACQRWAAALRQRQAAAAAHRSLKAEARNAPLFSKVRRDERVAALHAAESRKVFRRAEKALLQVIEAAECASDVTDV